MNEFYVETTLIAKVLGISVQAVNQRAGREKWPSRKRTGRGGGREYPLSALPVEAQAALIGRESPQSPQPTPPAPPPTPPKSRELDPLAKAAGDAAAAQLQGKAKARLDAKLSLLDSFSGLSGGALMAAVVRYNAGELPVPDHVRAVVPAVSVSTIHRWRDHAQRLGLVRVAGKYGNRKGTGHIDSQPELGAALRGLIVETPHVRPGFAREWLGARYPERELPSPMTLRRWMVGWKNENAELYCRLSDPDRWKSRYMLGWGDASAGIIRLNQEWQFDSTPADLLLEGGRHALIGVIDVYSRRAALHVAKTSKSAAIAALTRRVLLDWGVPEKVKTDNGQDYVSNHLARIFQALGVEHEKSAPFSPWQKPHIERFFRTFAHDLVEMLPGYIGHDVAEREQLRARQQFSDRLFVKNGAVELPGLSAADLQGFCDRWCAAYHARPHGGHGMDGQSPLVKAAGWREPIRAIADERVLDLLLAAAPGDGWRSVSKADGVQVDGYAYLSPALALHARERVRVLYDPEGDMGQVWCFDEKGGFITIAECPELRGLDRKELAARAKSLQQEHIQAAAKAARAEAKGLNLKTAVEDVQAARAAAAATLVAFPTPTVAHASPGLAGAAAALRGESALSGGEITPETLRAAGYTPPTAPEPAEVVPIRLDGWLANLRDLCARTLGAGIAPTVDEAGYLAEYYRDARTPRIFENEMAERYGYERFQSWKRATLATAAAHSAVPRQEAG
ncbi:MAG: DDE-type integrase/transposase/recombinase [Candidatus Competibacteraceae bacterium]